ncbi:helix-turn-helix domain-containing protein [Amycolatopsis nigrescens]|uniref:helix-turn-helix domain-containing protein n=1 Tax=Amycolatopsis nigrescens TaxID=381445 RepID=UPI0004757E72|nr:helix-turn-helix domain-containing protein [Amycolatopsis nigrescens]
MSVPLEERTFFPPEGREKEKVEQVAAVLAHPSGAPRTRHAHLISPDGTTSVELPAELYQVLCQVVDALQHGQAVAIEPLNSVLTTQQAADKLHISRPTLVKLLEDGKIPFHQHGRHRRVFLADLLAYEEKATQERQSALDELTYAAAHDGSADETEGFIPTR